MIRTVYPFLMHFTVFDSFIFKTHISRLLIKVELAYGKVKARFYFRFLKNVKFAFLQFHSKLLFFQRFSCWITHL